MDTADTRTDAETQADLLAELKYRSRVQRRGSVKCCASAASEGAMAVAFDTSSKDDERSRRP
jgi:hypothetical protein